MRYVCKSCGFGAEKWYGRCPSCGEWNTFSESSESVEVYRLSEFKTCDFPRIVLPYSEVNRVLGGGIVPGSSILIGGEPGIGKSTLLLQIASSFSKDFGKVLYIAGEESVVQIKLRAERLKVEGEELFILPETQVERILDEADKLSPSLLIVDSIQSLYSKEVDGFPGGPSQVRESASRLIRWAKPKNIPLFLIGHVTKEGVVAGPHTLEHMVDVVLYLEGERLSSYRILRSTKNRFGSTNEVGIFEMRDEGLKEIENPSSVFLSRRDEGSIGSVIFPSIEGTRPILVEIQALTNPTSFSVPSRTANGIDPNRLIPVSAVLSKWGGMPLHDQDIMANIVGGLRIDEPGADLPLALAIASSFKGFKISPKLVAIGEIGLSGEIRQVSQMERRLKEAERLGFEAAIIPEGIPLRTNLEILPSKTITDAMKKAFTYV